MSHINIKTPNYSNADLHKSRTLIDLKNIVIEYEKYHSKNSYVEELDFNKSLIRNDLFFKYKYVQCVYYFNISKIIKDDKIIPSITKYMKTLTNIICLGEQLLKYLTNMSITDIEIIYHNKIDGYIILQREVFVDHDKFLDYFEENVHLYK